MLRQAMVAIAIAFGLVVAGAAVPAIAAGDGPGTISGDVHMGSATGTLASAGEVKAIASYEQPDGWIVVAGSAMTDAEGHYSITGLSARSYTLEFDIQGDAPYSNVTQQGGGYSISVDASTGGVMNPVMPLAGTLTGLVTDTSGNPISNAQVTIKGYLPDGTPVTQSVNVGADGRYTMRHITAATYFVEFDASPLGPPPRVAVEYAGQNAWTPATQVALGGGTTTVEDKVLEFAGSLRINGPSDEESWPQVQDSSGDWVSPQLNFPANGAQFAVLPGTYRVETTKPGLPNWGWAFGPAFTVGENQDVAKDAPTVVTDHSPDRIGGDDRFAVAVALADQEPLTAPVSVVYIANGLDFPDALSAGPAAVRDGGTLLTVTPTTIPAVIRAELVRLQPQKIVVVGGPASVSDGVFAQLATLAGAGGISRISGADRYAVSRSIAATFDHSTTDLFLATGATFPDALSAGAAAGSWHAPVLVVPGQQGTLDAATMLTITGLGVRTVHIVGGPASVSDGIETQLRSAGMDVGRETGADRYQVSDLVNEDDVNLQFQAHPQVFVAAGGNFPDALTGAVAAGLTGSPLVVVPSTCVPDPDRTYFSQKMIPGSIHLVGGPASLSSAVLSMTRCATPVGEWPTSF